MTMDTPDDEALRRGDVDPHVLASAGLVAELIVDIRRIAGAVEAFAAALAVTDQRVDELADLRNRNRTLGRVVAGLALGVILTLALAIGLGWSALDRLTTIANDNAANGRVLIECTTPSPPPGQALDDADRVHECAERGAQAQAGAIGLIGDDVLDAAYCARTVSDPDTLEACFTARRQARAAARSSSTP